MIFADFAGFSRLHDTDLPPFWAHFMRAISERLAALAKQPMCLAAGGMDAVLKAACMECAGYPQPVVSAAVRVLQLCGSTAKAEDLKD